MTFWVVIHSDSEFIAWVWTQLSYFEYKSAPKKEHMHVQLPGRPKWKIRGHCTKKLTNKQTKKPLPVLGVVCMLMTMWNVWAHEYLAILVGCHLFTAYWLSAIIWSRFVNETHEYLIIHLLTIGGKPKTWWISVGTCEATHWQPGLVTYLFVTDLGNML